MEYLTYDRATVISNSVTVFDANGSLSSATVQISDGYENGRDVLSFTNTATITGSWDAATGTLTLSGKDTPAKYQEALRFVEYQNTSANPTYGKRTVSFRVNDGTADSGLLTRDIHVQDVLDGLFFNTPSFGSNSGLLFVWRQELCKRPV